MEARSYEYWHQCLPFVAPSGGKCGPLRLLLTLVLPQVWSKVGANPRIHLQYLGVLQEAHGPFRRYPCGGRLNLTVSFSDRPLGANWLLSQNQSRRRPSSSAKRPTSGRVQLFGQHFVPVHGAICPKRLLEGVPKPTITIRLGLIMRNWSAFTGKLVLKLPIRGLLQGN